MSIKKNVNGYWIISDIIDGYRVQKIYIGYTKRKALSMFKKETNETN